MEALASQARSPFPRLFTCRSCLDIEQSKVVEPKKLDKRLPKLNVKRLLRRSILQLVILNPICLNSYTVIAAPMMEMKEPDVIRTLKLPSGVRIQAIRSDAVTHPKHCDRNEVLSGSETKTVEITKIVEGEGPEAHEGDLVEVNYVYRRSNGYFVHSTVDQFTGESAPVILPLDEEQVIKGLKDVLVGMKIGGKRRALIPPSVGYINENLKPIPDEFGPRRSLLSHVKEPLIFEVQLLKIL